MYDYSNTSAAEQMLRGGFCSNYIVRGLPYSLGDITNCAFL